MAVERSDETIFTTVARLRQRSERLRALAPEEPPPEELVALAEPQPAPCPEAPEPESEPETELWIPADPELSGAPPSASSPDDFEPIDFERIPADVAAEFGPDFDASLFGVADFDLPREEPAAQDRAEPSAAAAPEPEFEPEVETAQAKIEPEPELEPELQIAEPEPEPEQPAAPEPETPESEFEPADAPAFVETSDIIRNDLAQPLPEEPPAAEISDAPDPDFDAVQERALAGLVDPGERERLVEKYAPVVDLQRLPKSRPQRVLDKAKKLAADSAKPTPAPKPVAPAYHTSSAVESIGEPQPDQRAKPSPPDSGDKPKAKKKRVSLLDSYFKGL